ncbi:sugar transporter ERD6-like 5 [Humulus lupulus]|uniref:sugar transporter ERD6-like 5 n=1 Tax=Humulus lupulus TaxID=3486 RepID=UPI002B4169F5|nr:sugar transporter ERD6-like 5 [Humulus lupulus]
MEEEREAVNTPLLESDLSSSSSVTFVVVFSTIVASFSSYTYGNAVGYSSPAESGILNEVGLTLAEYSVFGSIQSIGAMCGALVSGKISDVLGRKGAMGVSDLFCIIGWLAIAFAKNALWLDVGRFLVGCGIGVISYVVPVYIAEISPKNVRGTFLSMKHMMISFGKAAFFLIGSAVNWRTLALIGVVPCLLQFLGLFYVPESPRWLMKMEQVKKFESALYRLRGENADISLEKTEIREYTEYSKTISGDGILSLFQRKYAYCVTIGLGLLLFQQFGGLGGIVFYTSAILQSAGFPSKIGSVLVATAQIITSVLGVCFIDKFGRIPLLLISAAGLCLGCFLTGLSFFLKDVHFGENVSPVLALLGLLVYYASFGVGMEGMPWIIASEVFPINIKGSAGSLINVLSWSSSWLVSYTFNFIFKWSSAGTFFIFAGVCGANVVFIWKMVPETKGRTLEELHASLTRQ